MSLMLVPWALAAGQADYWTCALLATTLTAGRGSYAAYRRVRLS